MATDQAGTEEDFEKPFYRARRALGHLWVHCRENAPITPETCDGCKDIHKFLTDPNYRGDEHYPVYVEPDPDLGPGWKYGPDEMEVPRSGDLMDCPVCDRMQPAIREANGDMICSVCKYIFPE